MMKIQEQLIEQEGRKTSYFSRPRKSSMNRIVEEVQ